MNVVLGVEKIKSVTGLVHKCAKECAGNFTNFLVSRRLRNF
jgi:hypothetical protein